MRGNPWYRAAVALAACGPVESGDQLRAVARALVLLGLEVDPKSVAELPRAWPITRAALPSPWRSDGRGLCDRWATSGPAPPRDRGRRCRPHARRRSAVMRVRA
jgi:hypothetical protein